MSKYLKQRRASANSAEHNAHQQLPTGTPMAAPQGRVIVADPLKLTIMLPKHQRMDVTMDRFSTLGDVKQGLAATLGVTPTSLILYRRVSKKRMTTILAPLALGDDEILSGKVKDRETLHVEVHQGGRPPVQTLSLPYSPPYTQPVNYEPPQASRLSGGYPTTPWNVSNVLHQACQQWADPRDDEKFDEEFAIKLQTEECGEHHAKLLVEKEASLALPIATSNSKQTSQPNESLENFGETILRGTSSQYDVIGGGGESACTSICLVAATHLLSLGGDKEPLATLDSNLVDKILQNGVEKHRIAASGHSCIDDLWTHPTFSNHVASLQRGRAITAQVGFDGFYRALESAWKYPQESGCAPQVAIILTKSPETVLCFANGSDQWYLFDSHGESNASQKVAYIMRFPSTTFLALALQHKFPGLAGNDNWQTEMYNSFEATPLVKRSQSPDFGAMAASCLGTMEPDIALSSPLAKLPFDSDREVSSAANFEPAKSLPDVDGDGGVNGTELMPTTNMEVLLDPLLFMLMADPVVCDDGYTYERSVIEQHFQSRRDAEEARQQGTEEADASTTCCGSRRREIDLTSPMTGDVVTDRLVPNRIVERQIVDFVEFIRSTEKAAGLSHQDLAEWQVRREEKRVKDHERAQEDRRIREEVAEMRRNREEAQMRRAAEAEAGEGEVPMSREESPSQLVRVVNRNGHGQRLSSGDLGIAVSLCDKSSWVSREYALSCSTRNELRCMVACCAGLLDMHDLSWCKRCGRLACPSCLAFRVTDFSEVQSTGLALICAECLMQIVDVMPRVGTQGQVRAFLVRVKLRPYMDYLTNRAVAVQDSAACRDMKHEFGSGIQELQNDIEELRETRDDLQLQIKEAKQRADQARADDGTSAMQDSDNAVDESVFQWQETCADLEAQYEKLLRQGAPDGDEDAQFAHFQAISDIGHRLEAARVTLMEARSRACAVAPGNDIACTNSVNEAQSTCTVPPESNDEMSIGELQEICATLQRQHETLLSENIPSTDEERQMAHFIAISDVQLRFETAQIQLANARTRLAGTDTNTKNDKLADQINAFLVLLKSNLSPTKPAPKKQGLFRRRAPVQRKRTSESLHSRVVFMLKQERAYDHNESLSMRKRHREQLQQNWEDIGRDIRLLENSGIQTRYDSILRNIRAMNQEMTNARTEQLQVKPASQKLDIKPVASMSMEELQSELVALTAKLGTLVEFNEISSTMIRVSEIEHRLQVAEKEFLADEPSPKNASGGTHAEVITDEKEEDSVYANDPSLLDAIGNVDEEWPLPLGLKYPTTRMSSELELLQNALEQNLPKSQQKYDNEFHNRRRELTEQKEELEDDVERLRAEVNSAEASAAAESERLEARRERRRKEETDRRERERVRLEQERRAREAEAQLRRKHAEDEEATRRALADAVGREDNARAFGGQGDLRMCKRCKAGPVENIACSDLNAHNDNSNTYKGSTVARTSRPNQCRHCGWFDSNWHNWPRWDGVFGPH